MGLFERFQGIGGFKMKRKVILLGLVTVLLLSQGLCLNARDISGNEYLKWPEIARLYYVRGLFDMLSLVLSQDYPEIYKKLKEKTQGMAFGQIVKIFDKHLEEQPEILHHDASSIFFLRMIVFFSD
jgi:hypothetical protein